MAVRQQFLFIFYPTVASRIGKNGLANAQSGLSPCSDMGYRETMDRISTFGFAPPLMPQFVDAVQVLRPISGDPVRRVKNFPDGRITMILRITQGSPESPGSRNGDICVAGPRRFALFKTVAAVPLAVLIRFQPGIAGLFVGSPAEDLRDRVIPIEELWGSEGVRLREAVVLAQGVPEMLNQVQDVLAKRARVVGFASEQIARHAVELMRQSHSAPHVKQVAARLGVTERHLRRAFHASVGVTPKDYLRILRLERVLRASRRGMNWSQAAVDAGYYDQSHMIAEFRKFIGFSPSAFVASEPPTPTLPHSCST